MIRAGRGGVYAADWLERGIIGIGWDFGGADITGVYCQALADKIGVMISTLSAFRVPTSFSIPEIYQA